MTAIGDQIKTCGLAVVLLCCFFCCTETENGDTMSVHVGTGWEFQCGLFSDKFSEPFQISILFLDYELNI